MFTTCICKNFKNANHSSSEIHYYGLPKDSAVNSHCDVNPSADQTKIMTSLNWEKREMRRMLMWSGVEGGRERVKTPLLQ